MLEQLRYDIELTYKSRAVHKITNSIIEVSRKDYLIWTINQSLSHLKMWK